MSLCAPIQDNQVILVHMPPCISPPAPWPLSSAKSYLPSGLYRVFHSFIIYLQCPTDFSLLWHLTKNLMVRYFSPCVHLRSTFGESFWKQRVDGLWAALLRGHFPHSSRRLPFWMCAPLSSFSNHKNTVVKKLCGVSVVYCPLKGESNGLHNKLMNHQCFLFLLPFSLKKQNKLHDDFFFTRWLSETQNTNVWS